MGILIREADLAADRALLLETLLRNREHGDNELRRARFQWSYFQNPFGQPRAWLAFDSSSSRAIGMVAAFPRQMQVQGAPLLAWNGGDTSIDPDFRTLGVAIKLRRAVLAAVDCGEMPFLYSFPVDRMRVVLEKIGHHTLGTFIRYGVLLRTEEMLQKHLGRNPAVRALAGLANLLPPLQWCHSPASRDYRLHLQAKNCFGEEYDALQARVCPHTRVVSVRSAAFLHWRFLQNPLVREFRIFRLEREGTFCGYAVVGFEQKAARILDWLVDGDRLALRRLLLELLRWLRTHGFCTLAVRTTASSVMRSEARRLGFWFEDRRDAAVSVYAGNSAWAAMVREERNWFLTQADRDV